MLNTLTSLRTATPSVENDRVYSEALLRTLVYKQGQHILSKIGKKQKIAKNEGTNKIQWRRYLPLPVASGRHILTEGVNPTGMKIGALTVEGSIATYGAYLEVSRQLNTYNLDEIVSKYSPLISAHAAETMELIIQDEIEANAGEVFAGTSNTSIDNLEGTDILTLNLLRVVTNTMAANRRMGNEFAGGSKYLVVTSVEGMQDLLDDSDLRDSIMIAGNTIKPVLDNGMEEFSVYNLKFVQNVLPFIEENSTNVQVHSTYVFGESPYAIIDLANAGVEFKSFGFDAKTGDNLGLTASIGWVVMGFGAKVLDAVACVKIKHAVTNPIVRADVYADQTPASL
ncbi:MAG: N4-gp56 family major capsid protein [Erysipelotrichaceae bacterium]|nr:N4-gp56 family major capsid protein [Erysipelotrichaceae bacterium]